MVTARLLNDTTFAGPCVFHIPAHASGCPAVKSFDEPYYAGFE